MGARDVPTRGWEEIFRGKNGIPHRGAGKKKVLSLGQTGREGSDPRLSTTATNAEGMAVPVSHCPSRGEGGMPAMSDSEWEGTGGRETDQEPRRRAAACTLEVKKGRHVQSGARLQYDAGSE
ncbi:hypothetical protein JB92DRAFT_2833422 [Gautieria morchelliformis]|nr:hypothetical protein JB92DRAFT_2833422 [Gautieria morchelliformis]